MSSATEALKTQRARNAKARSANSTGWSQARLDAQAARMREIGKKNKGRSNPKPQEGEYHPAPGAGGSRRGPSPPSGSASPRSAGTRRGIDVPAGDNQETKNEDEQQEGAAAAPKRRFIDEKKVEKVWPLIITKVYKGLDRLGRGAGWLVTFFFRRAGLLKDNERLIFSLQALQEEDRVTISELTAPAAMKTVPEWIANNPFKAFFLAVLLLFFVQGDVTIKQEEKKNGGTNQAGLPGAGANEGGA